MSSPPAPIRHRSGGASNSVHERRFAAAVTHPTRVGAHAARVVAWLHRRRDCHIGAGGCSAASSLEPQACKPALYVMPLLAFVLSFPVSLPMHEATLAAQRKRREKIRSKLVAEGHAADVQHCLYVRGC